MDRFVSRFTDLATGFPSVLGLRLYVGARLVHGDLSEYNILVVPSALVENAIPSNDDQEMDLQVVLIDFGQAVDFRHPEARSFLERDLSRVRSFFAKQGVKTMNMKDSFEFVVNDAEELAIVEEECVGVHSVVSDPLEAQS